MKASSYDPFAWFYNRYWGEAFCRRIYPVLQDVLLRRLPVGARILDLCCGTGQLAARLAGSGFRVTGLDGSPAMLRYARRNAPGAEFQCADARSFRLPGEYHAVVSTFDSLNHIPEAEGLRAAFTNARAALRKGGWFVFDLNSARTFQDPAGETTALVAADHVCLVRRRFDAVRRMARWRLTLFRKKRGVWVRQDVEIVERCYTDREVRRALRQAGFAAVAASEVLELGLHGSPGRRLYVAGGE